MLFTSVIIGALIGGFIGTKIVDAQTPEGELGVLAWGLVGVIAGVTSAAVLGIV